MAGRTAGRKRPKQRGWDQRKKGSKDKNKAANRDAAAALHAERAAMLATPTAATQRPPAETEEQPKKRQRHTSSHEEKVKRAAVEHFYARLGNPPPEQWSGPNGTVLQIRDLMHLPRNEHKHTQMIRRTLHSLQPREDEEAAPSPYGATRGGVNSLPTLMSEAEDKIAADCLISGIGSYQAWHEVNAWRVKKGRPVIKSRETVRQGALRRGIVKRARLTTKTGSKDKNSTWAKARFAQAKQLKSQLASRVLSVDRSRRGVAAAETLQKIDLAQIFWLDEKHKKCMLGNSSRWEWIEPNEDGTLTRHPRPEAKYTKEARFLFGVMQKTQQGYKMEPFEYTHQKVVGVAAYKKAWAKRIAEVNGMKQQWAKYDAAAAAALPGGRYELRYGDGWREQLKRDLGTGANALCCVTDLIDHVIAEGNRLFAGTPYANSWVMAHDALSAWWEEGAQAHLASHGFGPERQISAKGDTNEGTRYEGKLVGDSPELMPLDNRLFAYYEHSIKMHAALTRELPIGHPKRFGLGTPAEVSSTMRRVWEVAPTSEQIVHDISYYPKALDAIIAAEGAKVEDMDIRTGRRATRKLDVHGDCQESLDERAAKWAQWDP